MTSKETEAGCDSPDQNTMYDGDATIDNSLDDIISFGGDNLKAAHKDLDLQSINSMVAYPNHEEISFFREAGFLFLMCLSQLLTQAGVAQTMNTATQISDTFNVSDKPGEISWFSASFSLTVGTFILISGRLGDMYGYKLLYCVGYAWFGMTSLVCGFAGFSTSVVLFDVFRALQGIGPAIMMPNSQALIASYYPPGVKRNLCLGLFGAVAPSGFVVGALFSGIFAQLVWWPWLFWVCGICAISTAVIAYFVIPKKIGIKQHESSFDYLGSITGVTGLVLINFSWNQGPNTGWDKPYVYVLLIVGSLCLVAFYFVEKRVDDPLVPSEALQGDTGFVLLCIAAGWSCFGIWLFYTNRVALVVDQDSPILLAVKFIPALMAGLAAAFLTTVLLRKIPSAVVIFLSMIAFLAGILLMGLRPSNQIYWAQKFVSTIVTPFGMDMSFPAAIIILSSALPKSQQGIAGSLVSTFVNYSISIGLGFAGTVEYYMTNGMEPSLETTIYGYKKAFNMGMGLAGLGVVAGMIFLIKQFSQRSKLREKTPSDQESQ
jgi:MFS family permease